MLRAKIPGIASYVADYVVTNEELSHMVDTSMSGLQPVWELKNAAF